MYRVVTWLSASKSAHTSHEEWLDLSLSKNDGVFGTRRAGDGRR
jgi:hypothetical protein